MRYEVLIALVVCLSFMSSIVPEDTADDQTGLLGHVVAYGPVMPTALEDDIPPVTTAALDGDIGDNDWYVSAVTVTLSSADGQSDVDGTWYRVDGETWMLYSAAFEVTGDGAHEVEFYSADVLGSEEAVQTIGFKADTQTPTVVPGVVVEVGCTYFRYECADETSGLAFSEYGLDGGSFVNMGNSSSVSIPIATEGEHTIVVRIHDNAGNNLSSTVTFTVAPEPDDSSPLALYVGLAVVAAAVAAVAALLVIKRKR